MAAFCGAGTLYFADNLLRQNFAQFHAPLVERIDLPDHSLGENTVLVQGDQLPQGLRGQLLKQKRARWPITFEDAVGNQPGRCAFRLDLFWSLAESQRLALCENVRQQEIMMIT